MSSNKFTKIVLTGVVFVALAAMVTAVGTSPNLAFADRGHGHGHGNGNGGDGGNGGNGGDGGFCPGHSNDCNGGDVVTAATAATQTNATS